MRKLIAVLALVAAALTACTTEGPELGTALPRLPEPISPGAQRPAAPSGPAGGFIHHVINLTELGRVAGQKHEVKDIAVDARGLPVVVLGPQGYGSSATVARVGFSGGWSAVTLITLGDVDHLRVFPVADGSVVATGRESSADGRTGTLAVWRIAGDGGQSAVRVPGTQLGGLDDSSGTAVSPDGSTIYVTGDDQHRADLTAVDAATGAITAQTPLDPTRRTHGLVVTGHGDVALAADVPLSDTTSTVVLDRFDAALHPAGEMPLVADHGISRLVDLAAGADAVYLAVEDGDVSGSSEEYVVQSVRPGQTAPTIVASWDAPGYRVEIPNVEHFVAVDRAETTVWLLDAPVRDQTTDALTPVNIAGGTIGRTVVVETDTALGYGVAVSPDGRELYVAGHFTIADPIGPRPALWTID